MSLDICIFQSYLREHISNKENVTILYLIKEILFRCMKEENELNKISVRKTHFLLLEGYSFVCEDDL